MAQQAGWIIPDGPYPEEFAVKQMRVLTVVLGVWVVVACNRTPAPTGARASVGDVELTRGVAWGLASSKSTTIGFQVTAGQGDTLIGVESPDGMAMLHDNVNDRMTHLERLAVGAGGTVSLGTGGPHIMLTEATHGYNKGDSVRIVLQWARNGRLAVTVPLKNFTEATTLLEGR